MGSSSYSSTVFTRTMSAHAAAGTSAFTHHTAAAAGTAPKLHADMDPNVVAGPKSPYAGKVMRESRDSDAHPTSLAIACLFDVTGSMALVPQVFVKKLGGVMNGLVKKGYAPDAQVLFGAIGDETCDQVPLQIGQFESGNEMDDVLAKVYLESGGGGQSFESYELAMYFMARHTSADCWEKRGQKGFLFLLGDELPRETISKEAVKRVIGDTLEADIPLTTILAELREHYEVYWVFPSGTSYWDSDTTAGPLKKLFDQYFIRLDDPSAVAELIVATVGISLGYDTKTIMTDLVDAGLDAGAAKTATTALSTYAASTAVAKKAATVDGALDMVGTDTVSRL